MRGGVQRWAKDGSLLASLQGNVPRYSLGPGRSRNPVGRHRLRSRSHRSAAARLSCRILVQRPTLPWPHWHPWGQSVPSSSLTATSIGGRWLGMGRRGRVTRRLAERQLWPPRASVPPRGTRPRRLLIQHWRCRLATSSARPPRRLCAGTRWLCHEKPCTAGSPARFEASWCWPVCIGACMYTRTHALTDARKLLCNGSPNQLTMFCASFYVRLIT